MTDEICAKLRDAGMTFDGHVTYGSLVEIGKVVESACNEALEKAALIIEDKESVGGRTNAAYRVRALKTDGTQRKQEKK